MVKRTTFKARKMTITVKVINKSNNPLPIYQTEHAAGMDICAWLNEPVILQPMQRQLISTGLFIELPQHFEAQIRPRSGLALKHGITVLNSPGTIDADYRGEIKVLLINLGSADFTIQNGDRIAQMIVASCVQINWQNAIVLSETNRGTGGYGSTGIKL
jgi:dUTP pyrophosphatase